MKILVILGTRPEVIKLAPIIKEFRKYPKLFQLKICSTGQHQAMLIPFLKFFNLKPDYLLRAMKKKQSLSYLTQYLIKKIDDVLVKEKPDLVLVQGDTTTAFLGALAAFYKKIKIGHIEAGLRSFDKYNPFPEEINRQLIDILSDFYFAPTKQSQNNLIKEGVSQNKIFLTGNTIVDVLKWTIKNKKISKEELFKKLKISLRGNKIILFTAHRRESFGHDFKNILRAITIIAKRNHKVDIIYPVHLNPNIKKPAFKLLNKKAGIHLTKPLEYVDFINLMNYAHLIITDSGGIIEEASTLNKQLLIVRKKTERPEAVKAGGAKLIGTNTKKIIYHAEKLLQNKVIYQKMIHKKNPFGNGRSAQKVLRVIKKQFNLK